MAQQFTEEEVRALFFNRKKKVIPFEGSLPDLEMLDGQLGLQELSGGAIRHSRQLATTKDGVDNELLGAAMLVKSIVLKQSDRRIFKDTDIQGVLDFGLSVVNPIAEQIKVLSGDEPEAIQKAKDDFLATDSSASSTSSTEN